MREKELRIALICFGGVSLAVYMHGNCMEILKLVRASGPSHGITDRSRPAKAAFFDQADPSDSEYDTDSDYFELLQKIGHKIELRVIVDILAGASAGGINETMLARALSHDLPILRLRDLWLDNADVTVLPAPEARAGTWSKWILKPLIWGRQRPACSMRSGTTRYVGNYRFTPPRRLTHVELLGCRLFVFWVGYDEYNGPSSRFSR